MSNQPNKTASSGANPVVHSSAMLEVQRNLQGEYEPDTRVSSYERVSSFLISAITVTGILTAIGFMTWLTLFEWGSRPFIAELYEEFGNEDRPEGVADDWQEPGVEEFPEVEQPQLADALEAMTDAVSSVRAQLEKVDGNAAEMGRGKGLGDIRQRGKGKGNSKLVPEAQRWRIEYSTTSMGDYRTQLNFFDIELGALSKTTGRIDLIRNLTSAKPAREISSRAQEKRLYFSHTQQTLKQWDQRIARDAGVNDVNERILVQFYSQPTRQLLRDAEAAFLEKERRQLLEVQRTYFRIRPKGNGFEFYVNKMDYRQVPKD
ncbi:MAG TPA: hypothetical protein PKD64_01420 [Pirellulaceae bacterium]|nr:hypothetical protein [Pirellulaceae bacterium]HMO90830.1 hypothetical protein [Pirellulaceae bacterium]HMP68081.1 hypothetical protein [Pirellulaceae bacterium]